MKITDLNYQEITRLYHPFNEAGIPLLILKHGLDWEICTTELSSFDGLPQKIGEIIDKGVGKLQNSTKLAWKINSEYRNQGIMTQVLKYYVADNTPHSDGFEAAIEKTNLPSLNLAYGIGFKSYGETKHMVFLVKK